MQIRYSTVLLVVGLLLIAGCEAEPENQTSDPVVRPVKLIEVGSVNIGLDLRYPAVIDATESTELSFQVGGLILELPVSEAQDVEQGAVIARLDQRDFESNVNSARASFTNAEDEYQRALRLVEQGAVAQSTVDQRKAQRDVAESQLESAEKALEDSVLRAPFAGTIASVPVREQQTISPGMPIATLINVSSLDATINLPASVVAQFPATENPDNRNATVLLDAAPEREIDAAFKEADLVADTTSQTYEVSFTFAAPDDLLVLPGMNATLVLNTEGLGPGAGMVGVPLGAVLSDGNGQYVWRFDADNGRVSRQDVQIQSGIGETVQILDGLSPGDQIVGAGGAYLSEGIEVIPWVE
ncbi:MAG: efflux RND transporter periplasmic adaptor subunit [Pseudomonadota bacterium]